MRDRFFGLVTVVAGLLLAIALLPAPFAFAASNPCKAVAESPCVADGTICESAPVQTGKCTGGTGCRCTQRAGASGGCACSN